VINFKPRERNPLAIEKAAVWYPEQIWLFWRREKSLVSARIQTPHRPAPGVVTMPNTLPHLPPPVQLNFRGKGKGTSVPVQASTGPQDFRRLRPPDFLAIGTWW